MKTSEKRASANRRNAKRSTGRKPPEGKAVVAMNVLGEHGDGTCFFDILIETGRNGASGGCRRWRISSWENGFAAGGHDGFGIHDKADAEKTKNKNVPEVQSLSERR